MPPEAHPLDLRIKKDVAINGPTDLVRDKVQNLLWNMRFNGTWTLTLTEQVNEDSPGFECVRKERDSARISVCVEGITYRGFLAAPRRYSAQDVVAKLRTKNTPRPKVNHKITKILESLQKPAPTPAPTPALAKPEAKPEAPAPEKHEMPKHKFTAEEYTVIQDLTTLFTSGQQGKLNWFYRKMYNQSPELKNEVWHQLIAMGHSVEDAKIKVKDGPVRPVKTKPAPVTTPVPLPPCPPPTPMPVPVSETEEEESDEGESRGRKPKVEWSDEEWDRLADLIESMRRNNPEPPLSVLITRALAQFPQDRRRKLVGVKSMEPLTKRLKERSQILLDAKTDKEKLVFKMAQMQEAPSKDEILAGLTDEEVVEMFSQRVLDNLTPAEIFAHYPTEMLLESIPPTALISHAIQMFIEGVSETSGSFTKGFQDLGSILNFVSRAGTNGAAKPTNVAPSIPLPRGMMPGKRLPRVTVVGMKGDQPVNLESRFQGRASFNFIDKDQAKQSVPSSSDVVVFWARFCSHKSQEQIRNSLPNNCRIITHHGGTTKLAEALEVMLPKC